MFTYGLMMIRPLNLKKACD